MPTLEEYIQSLEDAKQKRQKIYSDYTSGLTYSMLAKKYSLSPQRIGQIVNKERVLNPSAGDRGLGASLVVSS